MDTYAPVPSHRVMTPQGRFTLCFCLAILVTGPFGLVIGPLLSRYLRRRAERKHAYAAKEAALRSGGHFLLGQIFAITACGIMGLIGLAMLVPGFFLPVFMMVFGSP